jgi:colicin import membrane protein
LDQQQVQLKKYIYLSLFLHIALVGGAYVWENLIAEIVFPGRVIQIQKPTLRVDMVGLPDLKPSELKQAEALRSSVGKSPKEKASPPPKKAKKTKEVIRPNSKDLMAAIDAIKSDPEMSPDTATNDQDKNQKESISVGEVSLRTSDFENLYKGNQISKGTSAVGEMGEGTAEEFAANVQNHVRNHWFIPVGLEASNLRAVVRIWIDRDGIMSKHKFLLRSPNPQFNDAVQAAVLDSNPYPMPPEEIPASSFPLGIELGFPI